MELRVLFLNSMWLITGGLLMQCSSPPDNSVMVLNEEVSPVVVAKGRTSIAGEYFTGILYTLHKNSKDTASIKSFKNGKPHGVWKEFYRDGSLRSQRHFKDGEKQGVYEAWWADGKIRLSYNFLDDEYEGNCRDWSETGQLLKSMNYKQGYEQGRQQQWDANGNLWANYEARNGRNYGLNGTKACATLWKDSVAIH